MTTKRKIGRKTLYMLSSYIEHLHELQEFECLLDRDVQLLFPKDWWVGQPLPEDALALVIDLDYLMLDAHGRRKLLADLIASAPTVPTLAISYDFDETLSVHQGVAVARKLNATMLNRLLGGNGPQSQAA